MQLAKEAFKALGIMTDPIDAIGGMTEPDFPTKEVRKLEETLRQETRSYIECLQEVRSGVASLKGKFDNLKRKMDQDQTGIN